MQEVWSNNQEQPFRYSNQYYNNGMAKEPRSTIGALEKVFKTAFKLLRPEKYSKRTLLGMKICPTSGN